MCPSGALERIAQVDQDFGVMVFASGVELGSATRWLLASPHTPEQRVEEIAEFTSGTSR